MKNRVIKFRAWDGTFMINPYCDLRGHNHFWGEDLTNTPYKSPISVMQFTGLHDKNGKEIYESDVVKAHDHPTGADDATGEVYYEQGSWRVRGALCTLSEFGTAWTEVIGNIYENPELCQ